MNGQAMDTKNSTSLHIWSYTDSHNTMSPTIKLTVINLLVFFLGVVFCIVVEAFLRFGISSSEDLLASAIL